MVYKKYSDDYKERCVVLWMQGWTMERIEEAFDVCSKSVARWAENISTEGFVSPPTFTRGRPPNLTPLVREELAQLIAEEPGLYLDEIAEWVAVMHGIPISLSQLYRTLASMNLTYKIMKKTAAQQDPEARAAYRADLAANFHPSQILYLDECYMDDRNLARRYGRSINGTSAVEEIILSCGDHFSILPAISLDGYVALRVIPGSITSEELYDFVVMDLIPKMNPYPQENSILIMDNCNTHKSEPVRDAIGAAGCLLIFLPTYSPDLNPIEQGFNALKAHLRRHWRTLRERQEPVVDILMACMEVGAAENARGWYRDSV